MKKTLCLMTAAFMLTAAVSATDFTVSASDIVKQKPVFQHFNSSDVNGTVVVELPEGLSAVAEISFDSPEGDALPYYNSELPAAGTYSFDIEGRDTTNDDFRKYNLVITAIGGDFSDQSAVYTDTFTVPDKHDNPDSFKEMKYIFKVDDAASGNDCDVTIDSTGAKIVAVHNNFFMYGDVNDSKTINSSDASDVLAEYSSRATSGESVMTEKQRAAADVNGDEKVDSKDASDILSYYSALSTGGEPKWNIKR